MVLFELLGNYFLWHYTVAIKNIFLFWWDFEWFLWNYFSIKNFISTFFVPWKRLGESALNYFDLPSLSAAIIVTTLMRLFGMTVRFIAIATGLLFIILLVPLSIIFLAIWILMPFLLIIIFGVGIELIIKSF